MFAKEHNYFKCLEQKIDKTFQKRWINSLKQAQRFKINILKCAVLFYLSEQVHGICDKICNLFDYKTDNKPLSNAVFGTNIAYNHKTHQYKHHFQLLHTDVFVSTFLSFAHAHYPCEWIATNTNVRSSM